MTEVADNSSLNCFSLSIVGMAMMNQTALLMVLRNWSRQSKDVKKREDKLMSSFGDWCPQDQWMTEVNASNKKESNESSVELSYGWKKLSVSVSQDEQIKYVARWIMDLFHAVAVFRRWSLSVYHATNLDMKTTCRLWGCHHGVSSGRLSSLKETTLTSAHLLYCRTNIGDSNGSFVFVDTSSQANWGINLPLRCHNVLTHHHETKDLSNHKIGSSLP